MPRFAALTPESAPAESRPTLEGIKGKLGVVPNMMRTMSAAPAVLNAYAAMSGALAKGTLSAALRERIALAVGQKNECGYCVSAHSLIGSKSGLSPADVEASRRGRAADARDDAAVKFALALVARNGHVGDAEVAQARAAGLTDAEILEVVGATALNVFTNWFNHAADPEIDFPQAAPLAS